MIALSLLALFASGATAGHALARLADARRARWRSDVLARQLGGEVADEVTARSHNPGI